MNYGSDLTGEAPHSARGAAPPHFCIAFYQMRYPLVSRLFIREMLTKKTSFIYSVHVVAEVKMTSFHTPSRMSTCDISTLQYS